jgi:type I restriction enzyme S subunit
MKERQRKNIGNKESNVLSLSYGKIIRRDVESNFGLLPESFETYQIVKPGNIVLRLTDLQNDKRSLRTGRVEEQGIITSAYTCLDVGEKMDGKFAHYLLHGYDLLKVFYQLGAGVRQTMKFDDLKRLLVLVPPLPEQQTIAAYLDRQTAKIDALIAKKQRLLELLAEQRAALISQAVTKGLNPDVKMKDSGVAWLGQVPSHWEVKRLKHVVSKIGSGKTPRGGNEVYSKEGVIFIRSQNVHFDGLHLDDVVYVSDEIDQEMQSTRVQPNDVLLNITGASLGRATVAPESLPPANVNQHVSIIRPNTEKIHPQFLNGIVGSQVVQAQIFSTENGAAREGLPYSKIANLVFAMPLALEEQKEIAEYLDYQTKRLTDLATKVETAIERLREYRAALISSVVTGKVQVKDE